MESRTLIYLDTHAAVFLYAGELEHFGLASRTAMESGPLLISPAVLLEFEFLREVERIKVASEEIVARLGAEFGVTVCPIPFHRIAVAACKESWTRDPFDRLIVAHAREAGGRLVTRDRRITAAFPQSVW